MPVQLTIAAFAIFLSVFSITDAMAHPHVWVDVKTKLMFDKQGRLTGFHHNWTFDEAYSAFAVVGLDADKNGKLSRGELEPVAKVSMESLWDFGFFTFPRVDGKAAKLTKPVDYSIKYKDGNVTLKFVLPLKKPIDGRRHQVDFAVYDPTFYVDLAFVKTAPLSVDDNAPSLCRTFYQPPQQMDETTTQKLTEYGENESISIDFANALGDKYSGRARLLCGRIDE